MTTTHPVPTTRFNGRALHLIDLENLAGGPAVDVDEIARTWAAYRGGVPQTESDHVMVGSCSLFARKAWWVLPATGVQRRVRDGADGGERSARGRGRRAGRARRRRHRPGPGAGRRWRAAPTRPCGRRASSCPP